MIIQWAAFVVVFFFSSTVVKYSKQTSEVFPIWNKCPSFPGNRFLTSLRSDTLNKSENWDLSSSHHHPKVYFSAANEYLLHNHKNFPNIMRLMISTVPSCCALRFWGRTDEYENITNTCTYRTSLSTSFIKLIKPVLTYNSLNDIAFHVGTKYTYIVKKNRILHQNVNQLLRTH